MNFESIILTSPDQGLSIEKDIRLIKIALLYSDKVTLVSPKTSMLVAMAQLSTLTQEDQFELIKEVGPILDENFYPDELDIAIKHVKQLKTKARKTRKDLIDIGRFQSNVRQMDKKFKEIGERVYRESHFEKLSSLEGSGKLELRHFDFGADKDTVGQFMLNEVIDVLNKSETKYPVFDELIGSMANQYSIENELEFNMQNAKEIGFGKELILQLPNIDTIEIEDILELKEELSNELSKFKGSIMDYSKGIESAPFTTEAKTEIRKQYLYHIKPELESLRGQLKQNKLIKHFAEQVISNASAYTVQVGLFLGICSYFDLEKMLSAAGVLTESTYKAFKKKRESSSQIKEHPLFFYNELTQIKK